MMIEYFSGDVNKTPGIDKMINFWLRHLSSMHQLMTKLISEIIKNA